MPLSLVSEGLAVLASSHTSVLIKPLQRAAPDAHEGDHLSGTGAAGGEKRAWRLRTVGMGQLQMT